MVKQTLIYQENVTWITSLKNQGYTFVDVGAEAGAGSSTFYEMEKTVIYGTK